MWSECHHSYLERDSYGSGSGLPPLPQLQAWGCLRLCGLGKGQFKAQNHVEKALPCWRSLMLPIVMVDQALRRDITALPCPLLVLGSLPWSLSWVLQAHPLGCACYLCVGRTCPEGAVNSFSPRGSNLPHLSLCPFKLLAAALSAEPRESRRPSWAQPVTS